MSGMEAAVASGLLKVAGHKLVSLIGSEFAAIARVAEDLSELHGIYMVKLLAGCPQFVMDQ